MWARVRSLNWTNVRLILAREVRDQLRDRRTLFVIAVLPILLYPLLGMSFFQIMQFRREQASRVAVVAAPRAEMPGVPALFDDGQFNADLVSRPADADAPPLLRRVENRVIELSFIADEPRGEGADAPDPLARAQRWVRAGEYDAAVVFPADFSRRLADFRAALAEHRRLVLSGAKPAGAAEPVVPSPHIVYTESSDKSLLAYERLSIVLERWTGKVGAKNLADEGIPPTAVRPFEVKASNMADSSQGLFWARLLPVLLVIWTLAGAFYPAIDLCAGEKERGTLETLLSSPAERSEIVLGKLVTIMLFSSFTAVLNLLSLGATGWLAFRQVPGFGPPPALSAVWLLIALVPVSALFSALALALAAFARSAKEGQYYLIPLLLITSPLTVLPAAPGVELTLGNSLIPLTGIVLLLRNLLEGHYWLALQFALPVIGVTLACCLLALRWAVDQFNSESVLFRGGERLDVGLWLQHLLRDRESTPTVAGAVFCSVLILMLRFFVGAALRKPNGWPDFALQTVVVQVAVILTPALMMTIMLTTGPRQTLLLHWPRWRAMGVAVLLAAAMHPVVVGLQAVVYRLYPLSEEMKIALDDLSHVLRGAPVWQMVLVVALVPAICEELAFRGFILSGFRHLGHRWRAVIYTAVLFGLTHTILQQSIIACLVAVVVGVVALQAHSIFPAMAFHLVHNSLAMLTAAVTPQLLQDWPLLSWVVSGTDDRFGYQWPVLAVGALLAAGLLAWFLRLPSDRTREEALEEAIDRATSL